jgi:hypothetical protein
MKCYFLCAVCRYNMVALWPTQVTLEDVAILFGFKVDETHESDPLAEPTNKTAFLEVVKNIRDSAVDCENIFLHERTVYHMPGTRRVSCSKTFILWKACNHVWVMYILGSNVTHMEDGLHAITNNSIHHTIVHSSANTTLVFW